MEFADGGDLQQLIDKTKKENGFISESDIWRFAVQMINGIKYLHEMNIVHRDLKCANVFLTKDGNVKLGDLNVSKVNHGGLMFTQTGTPYYASPEVWRDKPYDSKSDIWSLGCVLYEMCALIPPFTAKDMKGLYSKVIKGEYSRIPEHYSQHLANIIDMCLKVIPSKRLSAAQLLRTKEIVLHLRESKIEDESHSINLLDTIKLPSNFSLIKDRLPTAKYDSEREEIKSEIISKKNRGFSARGRNDENSIYSRKLLNRDNSLALLKESQNKPLSGGNIRVSKINRKDYVSLLPPKSNRPANYRKDSDYSIILPPIQRPAGLPSIGFDYRLRQKSETRGSTRVLSQNSDISNPITNRQCIGYRRRADIASRQKIQQNLINKAFGLPITPISRRS